MEPGTEPKKISFGFSKIAKKPNLLPTKPAKSEPEIELIKCLEGKEIKLVEERKETAPIIIPMKENGKTSAALASLMKRRAVLLGEELETAPCDINKPKNLNVPEENISKEDLEKRAAQEILADLQKTNETVHDSGLVLPVLKPDELPLDGAKESNLDDYESIPIQQYGLAMLRGMGWVEPPPSKRKDLADEAPMVRPKGMGLGADKALKAKPLLVQPEANEILEIKKQAYVRILGGKHKDAYGQIEGFDDGGGRVIVKLAIGGAREAFNEFLCQAVSKKEYAQYGKCINTAKYEEYKKLENEHGQIILKKEEPTKLKRDSKLKREEKSFVKTERDVKPKYESIEKATSEQKYNDDYAVSSSNRRRSRSTSRSRKHNSSRRYDDETYSVDISGSSTDESDTDSAYERRHKHHMKSKSKSKAHKQKSKSSKKKSRHRKRSSSNSDVDSSDETDEERHSKRERHSSKKNKKKTKKSKKQRSRSPSRHRR